MLEPHATFSLQTSIAVPSFVIPDTVVNNAYFLAQKAKNIPQIQEIGLCFFETRACLDYDDEHLPSELANLGFRWHIHLPLDLPWSAAHAENIPLSSQEFTPNSASVNGEENLSGYVAAAVALDIMRKVEHLAPHLAVLHPPTSVSAETQVRLLQEFASVWYTKSKTCVLLENIQGAPLYDLPKAIFASNASAKGYGVCLDIGHLFAFEQEAILQDAGLLSLVQMLHWSAPGQELGCDKHYSLERLSLKQREYISKLMPKLPQGCTHMIEVFRWQGIESSLPYLQNILET